MNSDVLQFEGQYCACDNTVLVESKLARAAKIGAERSFLPQKHGSKKKENLSLSQRMGVGVLFYDCERNLRVSYMRSDCGNGKAAQCGEILY